MALRVMTVIARMNVGGPATLLAQIIPEFERQGVDHLLVTGKVEANEIDLLDVLDPSFNFIYLDNLGRSISPMGDIQAIIHLRKVIQEFKPDILHTHTSKAGLVGRLASLTLINRPKLIHTYHGHIFHGYFGKLSTLTFKYTERFLAKFTYSLIAVSTKVKNDLLALRIGSPQRWEIIYPGLDIAPSKFSPIARSHTQFNLVWVGRFTKIKNPMLALETVAELEKSYRGLIEMVMVGGGELLEGCREFSNEMGLPIRFTGWSDQVSTYISKADLLVLTSLNEGLPIVILEAAAKKVATLSTNVGGISDFIVDGVTGFFSDSNPQLMAEKIFSISQDLNSLRNVESGAFLKYRDVFSLRASAESHLRLYKSAYLES